MALKKQERMRTQKSLLDEFENPQIFQDNLDVLIYMTNNQESNLFFFLMKNVEFTKKEKKV